MVTLTHPPGAIYNIENYEKSGTHYHLLLGSGKLFHDRGFMQTMSITSCVNFELEFEVPIMLRMIEYINPYTINSISPVNFSTASYYAVVSGNNMMTTNEFLKFLMKLHMELILEPMSQIQLKKVREYHKALTTGEVIDPYIENYKYSKTVKTYFEYLKLFYLENQGVRSYRDVKLSQLQKSNSTTINTVPVIEEPEDQDEDIPSEQLDYVVVNDKDISKQTITLNINDIDQSLAKKVEEQQEATVPEGKLVINKEEYDDTRFVISIDEYKHLGKNVKNVIMYPKTKLEEADIDKLLYLFYNENPKVTAKKMNIGQQYYYLWLSHNVNKIDLINTLITKHAFKYTQVKELFDVTIGDIDEVMNSSKEEDTKPDPFKKCIRPSGITKEFLAVIKSLDINHDNINTMTKEELSRLIAYLDNKRPIEISKEFNWSTGSTKHRIEAIRENMNMVS